MCPRNNKLRQDTIHHDLPYPALLAASLIANLHDLCDLDELAILIRHLTIPSAPNTRDRGGHCAFGLISNVQRLLEIVQFLSALGPNGLSLCSMLRLLWITRVLGLNRGEGSEDLPEVGREEGLACWY